MSKVEDMNKRLNEIENSRTIYIKPSKKELATTAGLSSGVLAGIYLVLKIILANYNIVI
jgi:hypothetical protein